MQLPLLLKGFNLFINGLNKHGIIVDIQRPKIALTTADYKPGGFLGTVQTVHGVEKLEMDITCGGHDADTVRLMGGTIESVVFRYQGALQAEDSDSVSELVGEGRGRILQLDNGTDKQADDGESKFKIALTYWRETIDGKEIAEIDIMSNKLSFGGHDQRAGIRAALGIL